MTIPNALRKFLKRLFCQHKRGQLVAISWDGVSTYKCSHCGKHIEVPL